MGRDSVLEIRLVLIATVDRLEQARWETHGVIAVLVMNSMAYTNVPQETRVVPVHLDHVFRRRYTSKAVVELRQKKCMLMSDFRTHEKYQVLRWRGTFVR